MFKYKMAECRDCHWVHFCVTRKHAESEVKKFNEYFKTLPLKQRKEFYGNKPSMIVDYEGCFRCGNSYKNFKKAKKIPYGSTIQPIIYRNE